MNLVGVRLAAESQRQIAEESREWQSMTVAERINEVGAFWKMNISEKNIARLIPGATLDDIKSIIRRHKNFKITQTLKRGNERAVRVFYPCRPDGMMAAFGVDPIKVEYDRSGRPDDSADVPGRNGLCRYVHYHDSESPDDWSRCTNKKTRGHYCDAHAAEVYRTRSAQAGAHENRLPERGGLAGPKRRRLGARHHSIGV